MNKSIGLLAFIVVSSVAMGQGMNVTTTGNATLDGNPFVSGTANIGDVVALSGAPSSLTAVTGGNGTEFGGNRLVLQFNSFGSGTVYLPTDQFGSTASESAGSGAVIMPTWDSNSFGGASQLFNAGITSDPNGDTSVTMDTEAVPLVTGTQDGGTFTHDFLPAVVSQSYTANLNMNMPTYSFSRPLVNFQDGTSVVSPFAELASSGVWVVLGNASNSFQYIFQGPLSGSDPTAQMFNAGDPVENQVVGPWSNVDSFNFSGVAPGAYTVTYYAITWDTLGLPDGSLTGDSSGNFQQSDVGTILVTPEPASFAILGIGALGLLRRRSRR